MPVAPPLSQDYTRKLRTPERVSEDEQPGHQFATSKTLSPMARTLHDTFFWDQALEATDHKKRAFVDAIIAQVVDERPIFKLAQTTPAGPQPPGLLRRAGQRITRALPAAGGAVLGGMLGGPAGAAAGYAAGKVLPGVAGGFVRGLRGQEPPSPTPAAPGRPAVSPREEPGARAGRWLRQRAVPLAAAGVAASGIPLARTAMGLPPIPETGLGTALSGAYETVAPAAKAGIEALQRGGEFVRGQLAGAGEAVSGLGERLRGAVTRRDPGGALLRGEEAIQANVLRRQMAEAAPYALGAAPAAAVGAGAGIGALTSRIGRQIGPIARGVAAPIAAAGRAVAAPFRGAATQWRAARAAGMGVSQAAMAGLMGAEQELPTSLRALTYPLRQAGLGAAELVRGEEGPKAVTRGPSPALAAQERVTPEPFMAPTTPATPTEPAPTAPTGVAQSQMDRLSARAVHNSLSRGEKVHQGRMDKFEAWHGEQVSKLHAGEEVHPADSRLLKEHHGDVKTRIEKDPKKITPHEQRMFKARSHEKVLRHVEDIPEVPAAPEQPKATPTAEKPAPKAEAPAAPTRKPAKRRGAGEPTAVPTEEPKVKPAKKGARKKTVERAEKKVKEQTGAQKTIEELKRVPPRRGRRPGPGPTGV